MARLLFQGHGSLRLVSDEGTVVYIDPFAGEGYDLPADLILVSHQHYDHNAIDKVTCKKNCVVFQNMDAIQNGEYQTIQLNDIQVEAVEAYNKNHKKDQCVGFLVTVDGKLLYFAGDTSRTEQMETFKDRKIDYAFLPTDGIYNMNVDEASRCAALIQARYSVPIHMVPGELFGQEVADRFRAEGKLMIEPGTEIEL